MQIGRHSRASCGPGRIQFCKFGLSGDEYGNACVSTLARARPRSKCAPDITDVLIALADALLERNGDLARCASINAFASLGLSAEESRAILKHTEHTLGSLRDALGC